MFFIDVDPTLRKHKGDHIMKQIKWIFVMYAVLAAASIMGIGVAISEKSVIGVMGSIVLVVLVMGMGFKTKRKMRESGKI